MSRAADEGEALAVFFLARPFADEDQAGVRVALAGDRLGSRVGEFFAEGALGDFVGDALQGVLAARAAFEVGGAEVEKVLTFDVLGGRGEFFAEGVGGAIFGGARRPRQVNVADRFRGRLTRRGRRAGGAPISYTPNPLRPGLVCRAWDGDASCAAIVLEAEAEAPRESLDGFFGRSLGSHDGPTRLRGSGNPR